ncbi:MAG TPA: transketolase [Acidobacteria bacterium]|nr:transketolase [Acidobacteriota bacterium]
MAEEHAGKDADRIAIDTVRFLAVDMVEKAQSGHPGAPLGQAPMACLLWTRHLRHHPANPDWPDRDRFVLSSGHASALLYALLHLSGYDLSLDELQRFRQWGSQTPGHPEHGHTRGVETTTGPLGQGLANAVGMAIAQAKAASAFNRDGFPLFGHRIWVIASDGDLMEGVSHEACSLAGHLRLASLKVLYDDNEISIDGSTGLAFSDDSARRFESYGWRVLRVADGNDLEALEAAMAAAEAESERPTLVVVRTVIGYGSPHKAGSAEAHGSPLGAEEVVLTKQALGWPTEPTFLIPAEAHLPFAAARERGAKLEAAWNDLLGRYRTAHPEAAADLDRRLAGELPAGWADALPVFAAGGKPIATRAASGQVINALAGKIPELVGGSADLAPSNNTLVKGETAFSAENHAGRNFHFGVREHGMGSVMNGMALSRLWIPYGGTFLIFADYMRPPVRLAALMGLQTIYVYTHDSIFLGEDGPTHQPVSQLASLRAIPSLTVIRPADACETAEAWRVALEHRSGPTVLALTRQNLPILEETVAKAREGLPRGGYVLLDPAAGEPEVIVIATGSEVSLAVEAAKRLNGPIRVVSLPSWELFDRQPRAYRDAVLPPGVRKRLAIEAASPFGWHKYVGLEGEILGIDRFGASAPAKDLAREYGFTVEAVVERLGKML